MNNKLLLKPLSAILILTMLLLTSCKNLDQQLKEVGFWKYADGFYLGDQINFNSKFYKIKNDTIYQQALPKALLIKIETRLFSADKLLYIKALHTDKKGRYVSK